jgi:hypothetical protein
MGTFTETSIIIYRFADQGKQTFVFHFPFAENKQKFAVFSMAQ